ncbi:hypothetical protein IAD21_00677 [Abditibacteriota bacterium]|nr:hypothetical protein IAD21_00677 [Abditibacteriota bacterium]
MPNPLTLFGDSLKALIPSQRLSFSPTHSALSPPFAGGVGGGSFWLGSLPSGAKKDYGALVGDPLQNYVIAAAVNAVALALPDAPPYLENLQDGRWVRVDDHPVLHFLRQPHEDLDDAEVWSLTSLYRLTRGEAFWIIHLSDAGQPSEAVPYDPRRVRVIGTRDELISGYEITTEDGRLLPFPKQQVLHFRHLPDPNNPRRGWTPLSTGTRHLVGSNAASTYHTALLLNGAVSSWLISMRDAGQGNVTPEQFQTFIDAMRRKYSGTTESAGGIDGLSIPLEIQRMAYSPDEMAIDKLVDYYEQTLCSLTGVSKKLLDLGSDATYLNLREAISDFWERRLVPMRNKDARALTNQLLPLFGLSPTQWRVNFDFSNVPALHENQDALFTRWRDLYKAGGIDLYTLQTKIGLPNVPDNYKERFFGQQAEGSPDDGNSEGMEAKTAWVEAEHPRDYHGMFESDGGGSSQSATPLHIAYGAQFHATRQQILPELINAARTGTHEISYLIDADTGQIIDRQEGSRDQVQPDMDKIKLGQRVVAIHSHPPGDEGGIGPDDWDVLGMQPQIGRIEAIDAKAAHIAQKPANWQLQKIVSSIVGTEQHKPKSGMLGALFQRALEEVGRDVSFASHSPNEKIAETNRRLIAKSHAFKDLKLTKEPHTDAS